MKVCLIYENNGAEYDEYSEWVSRAYLVPDDFCKDDFEADTLAEHKKEFPGKHTLFGVKDNFKADYLEYLYKAYGDRFTQMEFI